MSIAELSHELGFVVRQDKFVLIPTQEITILVFVINSRKMPVKLTPILVILYQMMQKMT